MMRRKPHVLVRKAFIVAALQENDASDRVDLPCERRLLRQSSDFAHGHVDGEIDLAGLNRRDASGRVLDDLESDAPYFRLRSPISVVALHNHSGIKLIFNELVRPGTDRLVTEFFDANVFQVFLRHHVAAEESQPLRRRRVWLRKPHDRFDWRLDFDIADLAPRVLGIDDVAGLYALKESIAEIVRGHFVAVMKKDIVAQLNGKTEAIGGHIPFIDQFGDQLKFGVLIERLVKQQFVQNLRVRSEALIGIPGRHIARPPDGYGILALREGREVFAERGAADNAKSQHLQERAAFDLERHDHSFSDTVELFTGTPKQPIMEQQCGQRSPN